MSARTVRLVAAAALTAAALPAAAQQPSPAAAACAPRVAVTPVPAPPLAVYRFSAPRETGLPAEVTVSDSAGSLVASYRMAGERTARPLAVEVLGSDIVLQGDAPAGLLTMRLAGQNDADATGRAFPVTGRWWLGDRQGTLHGRAALAAR